MERINKSIIERVAPIIVIAIIVVFLLVILLVIFDWIGYIDERDNCLKDKGKEICGSYGYSQSSLFYSIGKDVVLRCSNERDIEPQKELRFLDKELEECGYK